MRTLHQVKQAKRSLSGLATREDKQRMYNSTAWRKYTKWFKSQHPLCVECEKQGKTAPTWATDHIKPHNGNHVRFWDANNHQPLCKECHRRKSQAERLDQ